MINQMVPGEWFVFGFVATLFIAGLSFYIIYQIKRFKRLKKKNQEQNSMKKF